MEIWVGGNPAVGLGAKKQSGLVHGILKALVLGAVMAERGVGFSITIKSVRMGGSRREV